MQKNIYKIISNAPLTDQIFKMVLQGDTSAIKSAGQFVNIQVEGLYLRRPISVCDYDENTLTLIYKIVGVGTEALARLKAGGTLDLLTGLGNGFNTNADCKKPLVIGGGVGIPPLFNLTKKLIENGKKPQVILCFNTKNEMFFYEEFKNLGINIFVATVDGSFGTKGFFSDVIKENALDFDYYFTCGPMPMLKSIHQNLKVQGQISFEERMGCGFGGCMGCTHKTKNGYKKVCTDTILSSEEAIFKND
jgi:dihydroorotate dehydrogenase electron transfer subunit